MADKKAEAPAAKAADPKKDAKKEAAKKEKKDKKAAAAAADGKKDQKKENKKERKAKVAKSAAPSTAPAAADTKHTVDGKEVKAPYLKKVVKAKGETVTEVDAQVARALLELEASAKDLAPELTDLFITAAKEVDAGGGKKAVVVFVPYRQHNKYKKIQSRLIRELEKKLSKHVVIIAQRTILSKNYSRVKKGQLRPRSRTLTAVHNSVLDDLVYPTLIVGKRLRVRLDGSRLIKIHLDPKDSKEVDYKLKTFQAIYKKLTNKTVEFSFPIQDD